jgi:hypothetical protein
MTPAEKYRIRNFRQYFRAGVLACLVCVAVLHARPAEAQAGYFNGVNQYLTNVARAPSGAT